MRQSLKHSLHARGDELRAFMKEHGVYTICGDRHWQYVSKRPATSKVIVKEMQGVVNEAKEE